MEISENMRKAVEALKATHKWGEEAAIMGLLAHGRCEYYDRDLLGSIDAYKAWEADHIVPLSAGGSDELENRALACRSCNVGFKGRWNPETAIGKHASRDALIAACRQHITEKRKELKIKSSSRAKFSPSIMKRKKSNEPV
jgi:hypothetical protein